MLEVRDKAVGRALLALPGGDRFLRLGAACYRALVGDWLAGRATSKACQRRMREAQQLNGIRYRAVEGPFPSRLAHPYDVRLQATFPDGYVMPIHLTSERGYEDIDGRAHLHLYERFASEIAKDPPGRVLDCACGSGYGSAYLSSVLGREIVGVDVDAGVIDYAQRRYAASHPTVTFVPGDATALPFIEEGSMAAVVSIETIEHVPEPEKVVEEFGRILKEDGSLYITSPDATGRPGTIVSPFHVTEYTVDSFRELLEERFATVEIGRRSNYLIAACRSPRR